MDLIFWTLAVGAAFTGGWLTARTIDRGARKRAVLDDPIAHDDFTRSVMDWGRRCER